MHKILLVHQDKIQHYRVSIYNYLSEYLKKAGYDLTVVSEGVQGGNEGSIKFDFIQSQLNYFTVVKHTRIKRPEAVILFVNLKNLFLFPYMFYLKMGGVKIIYWGHGIDLQDKNSRIKKYLYNLQHALSDALILYADHLKKYISSKYHYKCFVAYNTLNFEGLNIPPFDKRKLLQSYGITTKKNIIITGRIQKRKRIQDLLDAFGLLPKNDIGLIIVGPVDKDLKLSFPKNKDKIHFLGSCYGIKALQLMMASDVYCIPGAIGLSIVDAQYCGLPVVTEDVEHGPEIMYLKDKINGFIVPFSDVKALANRLELLLTNDELRRSFSKSAKNEMSTQGKGNINRLCEGFLTCLEFLLNSRGQCIRGDISNIRLNNLL